ncbi:MAG: hypothetical protein V3T32_07960 [Thermodesulfobacteriota bacterium]
MSHVERPGLYIMVFIILVSSCDTKERMEEVEQKLEEISFTQPIEAGNE